MDPSLVVLLCVFVLSVTASVALAAYMWHRSRSESLIAGRLLSSAMEVSRQLELTVAQRSSMADEVAALRVPLVDAASRSKLLSEDVQKATVEMAGNLASIPKMVEAMTEVGKLQLKILEQIQQTAKMLYESLYSRDASRHLSQTAPEAADREYEIQEIMRSHGVRRSEAEDVVRRDRSWSELRVGE